MNINIKDYGKIVVFLLKGELDLRAKERCEKIFQEQIEKQPEVVCIDCSELTYIDSSGLGVFINFSKIAKENNFEFVICEIDSKVGSVFDISKLDQFFKILSWKEFEKQYPVT